MWSFHLSLSLKTTPRNLNVIWEPFIVMEKESTSDNLGAVPREHITGVLLTSVETTTKRLAYNEEDSSGQDKDLLYKNQ